MQETGATFTKTNGKTLVLHRDKDHRLDAALISNGWSWFPGKGITGIYALAADPENPGRMTGSGRSEPLPPLTHLFSIKNILRLTELRI